MKHTQTIRWQQSTNCLNVFNHFVGLVLKELKLVAAYEKLHHINKFPLKKNKKSDVFKEICAKLTERPKKLNVGLCSDFKKKTWSRVCPLKVVDYSCKDAPS